MSKMPAALKGPSMSGAVVFRSRSCPAERLVKSFPVEYAKPQQAHINPPEATVRTKQMTIN